MLACLPRPGDLSLQLLPHTQMNTGLQKWDTTQRMRSAQYPTPAELDAYAKKVANSPLTIKIFPNSVKVPQRNHVRRTVNGLDTSGQRYSPYPPSQASAKTGLLAIIKGPPLKGILKDFDGSRARPHPEVIMNPPPGGRYPAASASTLNLHHPPAQQGLPPHPQARLQTLPQQQGPAQGLRHPLPMGQHPAGLPAPQTLSHPSALGHPQGPPSLLLQQQHLQQQPPPGLQGGRKLPDAEAPPNVTVSTSTIPLSMAAGLNQGRQADLSTIVHQINALCQARAQGAGATSMCEGQIANPSPISRNLLINACSRASMHSNPAGPGFPPPNCLVGHADKAAQPPHNMAAMNCLPIYRNDIKQQQQQHQQHLQQQQQHHHHHHHHQQHQHHHQQQQQQQQQHHQQQQQHQHNHLQQQQQMRSWNQQQLAHLQHIQDGGGHPCKQPPRDLGFPCKGVGYPPELCVGQPYTIKPPIDKPTPSPPVNHNGMPGPMAHFTNGHYFQPHAWNSILPTPNSDSSGSQDLAMPFHGGCPGAGTPLDCGPPGGPLYRPGTCSSSTSSGQTNLMQTADYLGGDFQTPCFRDQNLGLIGKMHRPPMNRVGPEVGDGRITHIQHPGYR
ncbi:protein FAM222B isoform 1-T5 [Aplochiton taeniatus]